jgi:negative regulator of sigma E activity
MSTQTSSISDKVQSNIDEIELDLVTSSQYFKPRPGIRYVIQVDLDKHKINPVETKFLDQNGNPTKRYEIVIVHVNNQKEQIWTVSKTVTSQIIEQIRKGFNTLKVTRIGTDRSTIYQIEGVQ